MNNSINTVNNDNINKFKIEENFISLIYPIKQIDNNKTQEEGIFQNLNFLNILAMI